jgi:hypothetical protein
MGMPLNPMTVAQRGCVMALHLSLGEGRMSRLHGWGNEVICRYFFASAFQVFIMFWHDIGQEGGSTNVAIFTHRGRLHVVSVA